MNIFVLDPDPKIAASMHCDQHLHKMILESAQMLSTVASVKLISEHFRTGNYYKPTHVDHPCTLWAGQYVNNSRWLTELCYALDDIRMSLGSDSHSSMEIVQQFESDFKLAFVNACEDSFIFCGPVFLQYNSTLTVPQKYQRFYNLKKSEWKMAGRKMTWNGRAVPEFMIGEST